MTKHWPWTAVLVLAISACAERNLTHAVPAIGDAARFCYGCKREDESYRFTEWLVKA